MKDLLLIFIMCIALTSCERSCQKSKRANMVGKRNYDITIYSGGVVVFHDAFHGVVVEEQGNGVFYYRGDTLIEISGDYVIKSAR